MRNKRTGHTTRVLSMAGGLLMLMAAGRADALLIDSFDDTFTLASTTVGSVTGSIPATVGTILGGERDVTMTVTATTGNALVTNGPAGVYSHNQGSQVKGKSLLQWDGTSDPALFKSLIFPPGLGGVDLTEGGVNSVIHLVLIEDDLPGTMTFTIHDMLGGSASFPVPLPGFVFAPVDIFVPLGAFGGVDVTAAKAIELLIDGTGPLSAGLDVTIDFVETTEGPCYTNCEPTPTPEPGTWMLFGTGLMGMVGYGWRRKTQRPAAV